MASKCDAYDPGKLRVLIVSQIYNDIKIALPLASVISLGPADNASDIRSYVDKWAIRIQEKFELSHDQIEAVGRSTRARARGSKSVGFTNFGLLIVLRRDVSLCQISHA